ncbi:MAG: c-type cytochrome [Vicinamibacterales bacterium]
MKRLGLSAVALVVVVLAVLPAIVGIRPIIGPRARPLTDRAFESTPQRLERGRYLATSVSGCVFCHSEIDWAGFTVKPGTEGSGRSWAEEGLPFLTVPNITPDAETGAGRWTDDMLARAIREGIGNDGRALFPLMPYHQYRYMADEDLASIVVYLRSLPPIRKQVPPSAIPFPVNRFINAVPEPVTDPVPPPDKSDQVKYGDYLVRIGVCRDCHTPADAQGQAIPGMEFGGGFVLTSPLGEVASANITSAPSGIPYYTEELFLEMMRTGMVRSRKLHDYMPWKMYRNVTDEDLEAIFAYVKTIPPVQHRVDNSLPPTDCLRCGLRHGAGNQNKPAND